MNDHDAGDEPFSVFIVCTDKGQHERTPLARVIYDPGQAASDTGGLRLTHGTVGPWLPPGGWSGMGGENPFRDLDEGPHVPRDAYVFWCPHCSRAPQIKHEKFWKMSSDFGRVGFRELDISLLPF